MLPIDVASYYDRNNSQNACRRENTVPKQRSNMKAEETRINKLDGLRGIAILCVLIEHFGGPLAYPLDFGYYGVDLFFILSGYLITNILLKMPPNSFWQNLKVFIARRTFRIFPLYYILLILLFLFNIDGSRHHILPLVTYTWNYFCFDGGPFYLWSLSTEEQFYLAWPLVILSLRSQQQFLIPLTLSLIAFSYCQLVFNFLPAISEYNYTGLPNRMGSLCLGAFAAITSLPRILPSFVQKSVSLEIFCFCGILWSMMSRRDYLPFSLSTYATVISPLCSLLVICKCVNSSFSLSAAGSFLENRSLRYLGIISYGVYLFHEPLGTTFREDFLGPLWHLIPFEKLGPLSKLRWHSWVISFPLNVALSVGIASISWKYIEKPLLGWKNKRFLSVPPNTP